MAVGAGIAAAKIADEVGLTISVIGTPAEEILDGGGKILLLERGAFAGVHAAMMVHPAPIELLDPSMSAAAMVDVHYTGKAAHASAFPELGINAADALTIAQTAVGLLRQHIRPTDRIHGIITKGGDAPNIVPSETSARYVVRASSLSELEEIRGKVQRCFEAGAIATGSEMEIVGGTKPYSEMKHDTAIADLPTQQRSTGSSISGPRARCPSPRQAIWVASRSRCPRFIQRWASIPCQPLIISRNLRLTAQPSLPITQWSTALSRWLGQRLMLPPTLHCAPA